MAMVVGASAFASAGAQFILRYFKVVMPLLIPVLVRLLVLFVHLRLGEMATEFLAKPSDVLISLDMVPSDALMKLPVANWAEVARVPICLLEVVGPFLKTLIPGAVPKPKHMCQFMGGNFADSHEHGVLFLSFVSVAFVGELFGESMDTLDPAKGWYAIPKAVIAELLGEEVYISEGEDSDGILFGPLDRAYHLVEDADGVILLLSVAVCLGTKQS